MPKKYYWLKLKRDFFKRHDIQVIESMPNGKDYVLFYLKLLVESVDHDGELRFSEMMPYNEYMLSTITNTNIDITKSALKLLRDLKMVEILDDDTIYMNGIQKLLGTETYWAEQKRKQREELDIKVGHSPMCPTVVQPLSNQELDKDLDLDKEIDKDKEKVKRFVSPTTQNVMDYCTERKNNVDPDKFIDFYQSKGWMIGKNKMKDWKAAVRTWEKSDTNNSASEISAFEQLRNKIREDQEND